MIISRPTTRFPNLSVLYGIMIDTYCWVKCKSLLITLPGGKIWWLEVKKNVNIITRKSKNFIISKSSMSKVGSFKSSICTTTKRKQNYNIFVKRRKKTTHSVFNKIDNLSEMKHLLEKKKIFVKMMIDESIRHS